MKSQRGITPISLVIYVIGMTIMVAIVAIISSYFYTNIDKSMDVEPLTERTKFNSFFTEEVNHSNIKVLECKQNYIVFDDGVQYTFVSENKGIYKNKVKICKEVENCEFEYKIENGKNIVEVTLKIGDKEQTTTKYILQN